jgi:hypothetical protein
MERKEKEIERVIAKGKKREVFKDKVYELGEKLFEVLIEKWRVFVGGVIGLGLVVFVIWALIEREKNKKAEDLRKFEIAMQLLTSYDMTGDTQYIDGAISNLSQIEKNPKYISKIYIAWGLSRKGEKEKAAEELQKLIEDKKAPESVKRLAQIMKINILGSSNCDEVKKTWNELKGKSQEKELPETPEDEKLISIPLRTYYEIMNCSKGDSKILSEIIRDLDSIYTIEQLISPEKANYIFMLKKFAEKMMMTR